tara:strand:- start:436 stop:1023 length:588 start_codon:yes stop_codon:yes gene_type:complete
MIGLIAERYSLPETYLYDLGCSLGAVSAILSEKSDSSCKVIAVDNSKSMISSAIKHRSSISNKVDFVFSDIRNIILKPSSIIVLNFTLQFIPLRDRDKLLRHIKNALIPGGFLILSEKVIGENEKEDALQQDMHYAFKRIQGYSDIEIKKKQSSLKDVLIPETVSQHKDRLQKLGFIVNGPWFQYLNFISMIARV